MEFRIKDVQLQAKDDGLMKIGGYINVTERESEMLYSRRDNKWFIETMKKGVFKRAIEKNSEIPLLFEHKWDKQLASTTANTLTLREDNIGLKFEAILQDQEVYNQVRAGVINSCSFGFNPIDQKIEPVNHRLEKRFVTDIELMEVSLVKNPAYVGSLAETRAYEEEMERSKPEVTKDESEDEPKKTEGKVEEETSKEKNDSKEDPKKDSKEDSKEEEPKEDSKEEEESKEKSKEEKRDLDVQELEEARTEISDIASEIITKENIKKIVDELVSEKLSQIEEVEKEEKVALEELEEVKEFHEQVEQSYETEVNKKNFQLMKMRLDLMKLKQLKEGI